jgi:hypothetical protein
MVGIMVNLPRHWFRLEKIKIKENANGRIADLEKRSRVDKETNSSVLRIRVTYFGNRIGFYLPAIKRRPKDHVHGM